MSNGVISIGEKAFSGCYGLNEVPISNSVTSIECSAFEYCRSLREINIPASVIEIGCSVFNECRLLTTVFCKPSVLPAIKDLDQHSRWGAFDYNADDRRIYIPIGSRDAYKVATGWSAYVLDMSEMSM